jgi:hypothetical protein
LSRRIYKYNQFFFIGDKKLRANPFTGILQCTLLVGTPHHQRTLLVVGTPLVGIPLGALVGTPHHHLRKIVRLDIHKNQIKFRIFTVALLSGLLVVLSRLFVVLSRLFVVLLLLFVTTRARSRCRGDELANILGLGQVVTSTLLLRQLIALGVRVLLLSV